MSSDLSQPNSSFDPAPDTGGEEPRSLGQSILYWIVVYLITIPITCIIVGGIVRITLGVFSSS